MSHDLVERLRVHAMSGSATITASPFGIVTTEVDRVEVEFIDGQRITAFPTDLTGRFDDRFWLVVTEIELDAPLSEPAFDGSEPAEQRGRCAP